MKIAQVEAVPLSIPFGYGLQSASRSNVKQLDFCLVRVETDDGIVGWGEAFSYGCRSAVSAAVRDMIAPLALGADAGQIGALVLSIQRKLHLFGRFGITAFALSGLDIALWDIAGKAAAAPLYQLLGGAKRAAVPCYASLLRYADPGLVARHCERALGEGYGEIKLHEVTAEAVGAARRAAGPGIALTVDANCAWTPAEALAMAQRMGEHDIKWLEEPVFPPEDFAGMRALGEGTGVAIASGENLCFATQFDALFSSRAVRYAQPSVTKLGGISEFLKVIDAAAAADMALAPHSPYFGPGALATLHLLASRVPHARFEHFYLWADAWLYPGFFLKNELVVPRAPGLGFDPDPEVLRRYRA